MTLNVAQYLAPLNSAQVLSGYTQGVKQGVGITIATDGSISLDTAGAATLGFLTSSTTPAPVFNWSNVPGTSGSVLTNDGLGGVNWTSDYVQTYPIGSPFPHTGAASIPAGTILQRPGGALPGFLRYNTDNNYLEFNNGTNWIPVSPPSGPVFSFVGNLTPTANSAGDLWLDTNTNQEKVWDGVSWIPTSPAATALIPGLVKIGTNVQVAVDGTISVDSVVGVPGGVSNVGVASITDNVTSNATNSALSANQGRLLQDQINALLISSNITLAGLISGAGVMTYVTPEGLLQGFTIGSPLPGASVSNDNYFVIVESAGGFTPPGGVFTVVTQGDWFLSSLNVWQFLNVGIDAAYATTTTPGIITLTTNADTQTGTDALKAVTPSTLSSRTATETRSGLAEIATQVETNAGVDDTTIVTPLKLATLLSSGGGIAAVSVSLSPTINGWTNVQQALTDAVYDITSTGLTVAITTTPTGLFNIEVAQATETQLGGAQIATQAETDNGVLDTVVITPLKLANRLATETLSGLAEIATQVETDAFVDDTKIVTPKKLGTLFTSGAIDATKILLNPAINGNTTVQAALLDAVYDITSTGLTVGITTTATGKFNLEVTQATEAQLGGAQIATQAETDNGVLDTVVVTPLKLRTTTIYKSDFNNKGDILSASGNDVPVILPLGANNEYLRVDTTTATGLVWGSIDASTITVSPAINGNSVLQTVLQDAVYDITSTGLTITPTETATGKFNLEVTQATEAQLGGAQIATQAETDNGILDTVVVTPLKLSARLATETLTGLSEIATQAETNAGLDDTRYVTPLKLATLLGGGGGSIAASSVSLTPNINGNTNVQTALQDAVYDITSTGLTVDLTVTATGKFNLEVTQATEAQLGGAQIATQAETDNGVLDTVVITPLKLSGRVASETLSGIAEVATQAETNAGLLDTKIVTPLKLATYLSAVSVSAPAVGLSPAINGNTNVQTALQDAVYDITSTGLTVDLAITATGKYTLEVTQATEAQLGGAQIATQAETNNGILDTVVITPLKLNARAASETLTGIAAIATQATVNAGTNDTEIVTAKKLAGVFSSGSLTANDILLSPVINGKLNVQTALADAIYNVASSDTSITVTEAATGQVNVVVTQATETQLGGGQIATQVETDAGTDDTVLITPLKLQNKTASTTALGIVQLNNTTTSTATNLALTAAQGKNLQDQINALTASSGLILAGTIDGSTGFMTSVTSQGTAAGFVVGSAMPAAAAGNLDYFTLVTVPGTMTPPGGGSTVVTQGDWWLSNGAAWQFLNVGPSVGSASTTTEGVVRLSTNAETQAGTDGTIAVTPLSLSSRSATETLTGLAEIATQVETETGTDDARIVTPLKLRTAAVYKSDFNAKGDLLSATADNTPVILPVGANGQSLVADSTTASGLKWSSASAVVFQTLDDISSSFNGAQVSFPLSIATVPYTPNPSTNIMVFVGGVVQIPGASNAYTVTGSNITFTSAPPTGASFYATTVA